MNVKLKGLLKGEKAMHDQLPIPLIFAWTALFGFVNTHQRNTRSFRGESQKFLLALHISTFIGTISAFALLAYYFYVVSWYWPIVLFATSILVGGFVFAYLDVKVGEPWLSLLGFVAWPFSAVWAFYIIGGL